MFCYSCGKQIDDDSLHCEYCGAKQIDETPEQTTSFCASCGGELEQGSLFCMHCGATVEANATVGSDTAVDGGAAVGDSTEMQNSYPSDDPLSTLPEEESQDYQTVPEQQYYAQNADGDAMYAPTQPIDYSQQNQYPQGDVAQQNPKQKSGLPIGIKILIIFLLAIVIILGGWILVDKVIMSEGSPIAELLGNVATVESKDDSKDKNDKKKNSDDEDISNSEGKNKNDSGNDISQPAMNFIIGADVNGIYIRSEPLISGTSGINNDGNKIGYIEEGDTSVILFGTGEEYLDSEGYVWYEVDIPEYHRESYDQSKFYSGLPLRGWVRGDVVNVF